MKKFSIAIISILLLSFGCKAKRPLIESQQAVEQPATTANYLDQSTWLLGYFAREQMYRTPHNEWYLTGYDDYNPGSEVVNKLTMISTDNLTIKVVMGTWCPDSRREVPRFLHVLDLWKFPAEKITFIGVDNLKLSPVGEYDQLEIQRVPTFIFYKNNIEAGRIIENPLTSLEQDIVNILTRE
ncbi:MAG: hypothetical protein QG576_420 [Bacteroidota bacterium]|nr:hypothetical protein [Bacteroidota bacterium]